MVINKIIFPVGRDSCKELYYRGNGVYQKGKGLVLKKTEEVTFDTYFNGLFLNAYRKYTRVRNVFVRIKSSGELSIQLYLVDDKGQCSLVKSAESCGINHETVIPAGSIQDLPERGMLFVKIRAESDSIIHSGSFETDVKGNEDVHLAVIICTYKREEYVKRLVTSICQEFWSKDEADELDESDKELDESNKESDESKGSDVSDKLDCFIIDNGRTLELDIDNGRSHEPGRKDHINVLPNRNYGGSGGFTRGMIEAYKRKDLFTHVLLLDDDISIEPESIARTIRLYQLARKTDRDICIGGQMLLEENPTIQYGSGGKFCKGRVITLGTGLDLTDRSLLMNNPPDIVPLFNPWYYYSFPITMIEKYGLPFPFFIKTDDVEYGLRTRPYIININGIGVWHQNFTDKITPTLEYYVKRNEMVTSILHDPEGSLRFAVIKMIRAYVKAALVGDPGIIRFLLLAYEDFMKGPDYLFDTDEEERHKYLQGICAGLSKNRIKTVLTTLPATIHILMKLITAYPVLQKTYLSQMGKYSELDFWCRHLGLPANN